MKLRISTKENSIIFIILIYCGINCFFNTVSFDNSYDLVFVILFLLVLIGSVRRNSISSAISNECKAIMLLLLMVFITMLRSVFIIGQSILDTVLAAREMLYFIVVFYFLKNRIPTRHVVKCIIGLEAISCAVYLFSFFLGHPLSPFAHFESSYTIVDGVEIYRDYSPMPLLYSFSCSYIIQGIISNRPIRSKRADYLLLLLMGITIAIKLFRTKLFALLIALVLTLFLTRHNMGLRISRRKFALIVLIGISAMMIVLFVPNLRGKLVEGFEQLAFGLSQGYIDQYHGTGVYRLFLLKTRVMYLIKQGQLLLGMGIIPYNDHSMYFKTGDMVQYMSSIYNPDSSYVTLLPRYGLLGLAFYFSVLCYLAVTLIRKGKQISVSTGVFIICQIIEGISGNEMLAQYGPLLIAMLVGLSLSEENTIQENIG